MLNVKIQNKNKNLQMCNIMSGYSGVPCKNSAGNSSLNSYNSESVQGIHLIVQGDDGIDVSPAPTQDENVEQNVGFTDAPNNVISAIPHPMDYLKVDSSQNIELGSFLQRPVQIYQKTWAVGNTIDAATDNFRPWHAFFNKTSIKKKLDNYYMLRCNLHLKFVINASPFFYGCVLSSYQPMTNFNPAPVIISATTRKENIPFSQRPHIYLYPQNSQGGEMVLPFLYHKNWLNATSSTDLTNMGIMYLNSFNELKNANGVVSDNIDITVYAWAEDIEVAGPTPSLAVQGNKDEYSHTGSVSRPASAIARAAGKLSSLPIIGEFATATSYAAGAVADIASLFGYTDVPVIDDVHAFQPKAFPNLAATDIGTPIEKLTLDSKNELSIDPKIAGANVDDELMLSSFVTRESYIFNTPWSATSASDTSLFQAKVTPQMHDREESTGAYYLYATPMSHVARCFRYWRGDIIFRFKFICSKYHRGRVRINWAPYGDIASTGDYTTETYTRIVDITQENDVEFVVPYTQPTSYLKTLDPNYVQAVVSGATTTNIGVTYNGMLTMRVLSQQTSPVTSADIDVLVFVRGADNLEFACPLDIPSTYSPYVVQGDSYDCEQKTYELGTKPSIADPNMNLIYMGESINSLRTLMRRKCRYFRNSRDQTMTLDLRCVFYSILGRQPMYPGYDPDGLNSAVGLVSAVAEPYNYVAWNYTTWFSTCFVGNRGAYNYIIHPYTPSEIPALEVSRTEQLHTITNNNLVRQHSAVTSTTAFEREFSNSDSYSMGMSGTSLTSQRNLAGTTISLPLYSRYKFVGNNISARTKGTSVDGTDTDSFITMATIEHVSTKSEDLQFNQDMYVSCGTDFSLIFFLNVPVLYIYDSIPTAV